jgi:predicted alpha/beta-hydrolase family hydrolase
MTAPEPLRLPDGADGSVSALAYPAATRERAGVTLILAHGAGAGQKSAFMVAFAEGLAARGIEVVTFDFPYMEAGRRLPDRQERLEACYGAAIEGVRQARRPRALVIGGKSMGGRIATHAAGGRDDLAGIVLLGYPLHPPGKPQQQRRKHLAAVTAPMLFVQGERDSFGTADEMRAVLATLRSTELYVVANGDHSFKVPKRAGVAQEAVYAAVEDKVAAWLKARRERG